MKKNILLFVSFIWFCTSYAQVDTLSIIQSMEDMTWEEMGDYGNDFFNAGKYTEVRLVADHRHAIARQDYGETSEEYVESLVSLNTIQVTVQQREEALATYQEARELLNEYFDKNHDLRRELLNSMGRYYLDLGQYEQSLSLYEEAVEIMKVTLEPDDEEYGLGLFNLALIHRFLDNYETAQVFNEQSIDIIKKSLGEDHRYYAIIQDNLATIFQRKGEYEKALPLFLDTRQRTEENLGKDHPDYFSFQNNLALLYKDMGEFEKALVLYQDALARYTSQTSQKRESSYYAYIGNLASLYLAMEELPKAISLQEEVIAFLEQTKGVGDVRYRRELNNLALIYLADGQLDKALSINQQCMDSLEHILPRTHVIFGSLLNSYAVTYQHMGNHKQALPLLEEAYQNIRDFIGDNHSASIIRLRNLCYTTYQLGMSAEATEHFLQLDKAVHYQIQQRFPFLSDRLQVSFMRSLRPNFDTKYCFLKDYPDNPALIASGFDDQLLLKGLLQGNQTHLLEGLRNHPNAEIGMQYQEWEQLHRLLSRQYVKSKGRRLASIDSLETLAQNLEVTLANQSADFRQAREKVDWQMIQQHLKEDEAVLEFSHFHHLQKGEYSDSIFYLAYILRPAYTSPKLVGLFEEKELNTLLNSSSGNRQNDLAQLYAFRGIRPKKNQTNTYQSLKKLIWDPIETHMGGVNTIYYSPSGLLNRINLEALPINKGEVLSDTYHMKLMGNTRNLIYDASSSPSTSNTAVLLGGIDYELDSTNRQSPVQASQQEEALLGTMAFGAGTDRGDISGQGENWTYLPATSEEVDAIEQLLSLSGIEVKVQKGASALEESLQFSDSSPRILHIATHGYFFPDPNTSLNQSARNSSRLLPVQLSDHPMVRSGLILAGANHAWAGNPVPEGQEDGILTAYEISRMDLSNTELVVLSACETGLGDIQGNEGVYGLQRAFKIAGAKYVMMSLWQVPDKATQELMTAFYEKWLGGMEIRAALQAAQKQMRKKYKEPYYWAGFVLVE